MLLELGTEIDVNLLPAPGSLRRDRIATARIPHIVMRALAQEDDRCTLSKPSSIYNFLYKMCPHEILVMITFRAARSAQNGVSDIVSTNRI